MAPSRISATVALVVFVAPFAFLAAACSRPAEQQFLTQFFRAARARDNNTLSLMSAVSFEPRDVGTVDSFEIKQVSEERRTPVDFKGLYQAQQQAIDAEAEFKKRKIEYQDANLPALQTIVKLERDPNAKMSADQLKMKAEWDKWRADTTMHTKAIASAKQAFNNAIGPAEASLSQPGQPPFNPEQFQGELVAKDVTIDAQVNSPKGQTSQKTLVLTLQRAVGTLNGQRREGRWIITRIQGA
jgi:hypothetical protein